MSEPTDKYELVFEGPSDTSPETIRRLKGAFISELECSIEETSRALQHFPLTIKTAESAELLANYLNAIKNAGGKVLVIKPQKAKPKRDADAEEAAIAKNLELQEIWGNEEIKQDHLVEAVPSAAVKNLEIEFELDTSELVTEISPPKHERPKATPVFELDENADLHAVLQEVVDVVENNAELKAEFKVESQKESTPEPTVETAVEQTKILDLGAPQAIELVLDSAAPENPQDPLAVDEKPEVNNEAEPAKQILDPVSFSLELADAPEPEPEPTPKVEPEEDFSLSLHLESDTPAPTPQPAPSAHTIPEQPSAGAPASGLELADTKQEPMPEAMPVEKPAEPKVLAQEITIPPPAATFGLEAPAETDEIDEIALKASNAPSAVTVPEPADEGDEELPAESAHEIDSAIIPPAERFKRKVALNLEIIGPIVGGAVILGGVNLWIFSENKSEPLPVESISQADLKRDEIKPPPPPPIPAPETLVGAKSIGGVEISWKAIKVGSQIKSLDLLLSPPPPPTLSLEEIGQGVLPRLAIRKIELTGLTIENGIDGSFIATGPALLAIDDAGVMKRAVGQSKISGTMINGELSYTIDVWTQNPPSTEFAGAKAERSGGSYAVEVRVSSEINPQSDSH